MTNGELKYIKMKYEELTSIKDEVDSLNEAIELYEQHPVVTKYLNLKRKLKKITKSHSKVGALGDEGLLEYIVSSIGIINTNNIYVYMGTYQQNDNITEENPCDFIVSYDDPNADYRLYINIESPDDERKIICTLQTDFEEQNIVLYPSEGINSTTYFYEIRNMYFKTAINEGQENAIEKAKVLSKSTFSDNDFITLLLSKLFANGISKIDTMKLKYILADYYSDEEYTFLFEDLALKEQIEGNYVELDDALLFAHFAGLLSNPIQGTNIRMIWSALEDVSSNYSIKHNSVINKLAYNISSRLNTEENLKKQNKEQVLIKKRY